jgi:peroxiredoxin
MLNVGDEAPDFELRTHRGGTIRLSDFRGRKNVVLAFHPLAFTPVCAGQMGSYEADRTRFDAEDAVVLGISIDAQPTKAAWAESLGTVSFDLLSDFYPHGDVARKYGVFREKDGISERALFIIDKRGRVAWAKTYEIPQQPDNEELWRALEELRARR